MRPFPYFQMPTPYPAAPPYAFMPRGFSPMMRMPSAMPMGMPMQAARMAQAAQTAASAPKWETFLQTANSFMDNAQKFTPYVQQAAPMIKNLPALWRMYRGFRSQPSESSTIRAPREEMNFSLDSSSKPIERQTRPSVPRIYQPPFEF
ncbi:VrrA/YqfQ family protein [Metasolibacillus sp.]|uniref:VrrA/YqfQ family protein n=1 Tax=Metasolibacillus sp. TaxID=2703680 RepID=UPI0025DD226F|nr:VrrA/YqfQ family protein [Metasolibacillus sp.]MCT6922579.1 YqfQ family protein [Metasolibacillus sp.]MCT6939082.1 YqfQ family protein [Metasolibacillus sp.]